MTHFQDLRKRIASWINPQAPTETEFRKAVEDFANFAVGQQFDFRNPATPTLDRNEFVSSFRNTVYISAGAIARKVAGQGVGVFTEKTGKGDTVLEPVDRNHPLMELFREVNPMHVSWDLWFLTVGWLKTVGDAYWVIYRNGLGVPSELWPVSPQWVTVIPDRQQYVSGFRVDGLSYRTELIDVNDMIHLKEPSLDWSGTGQYYGYPPLKAAAKAVDLEDQMLQRLWHQFKNFAPPGTQAKGVAFL